MANASVMLGYKADTTVWSSVDSAQKRAYRYLDLKTTQVTAGVEGTTLRGRNFSHITYKWNAYNLIISADAFFAAADRTFIQSWLSGLHRAISLDAGTSWIDVVYPRGDEPVEFLEGALSLTEYNFRLIGAVPA